MNDECIAPRSRKWAGYRISINIPVISAFTHDVVLSSSAIDLVEWEPLRNPTNQTRTVG